MRVTLYKKAISRLLLFVCLLTGNMVIGQQYPVQIVPQLQAPYTLNLSDYYNGTQEKLVVLLTNTDLNKPTAQVRLRMSIQGQVAKLVSRDNMYYPPIHLDAGIPLRITLGDLAPYFNADNLIFQGITRAQYVQSGKLPEGFYQFCFEAIETETGTNQVVGRSSCAMAWISLNDPPLLNLPVKAESIVYKDPQNIIFQWTPRNYNSPVSAFNTEYEFTLVELWDNGVAPEAAFGTAQPLYQTTTKSTTLLYGPAEPLLLAGHRYAWRIRAQVPEGAEGGDVWRNNGYSEIYWFTCQNNCAAPLNVQAEIKNGNVTVTWVSNPNQTAFIVDSREKGQTAATWYSATTNTSRMMLTDLKKDKTYEYRVGGTCDNGNTYTYSDIKTLTMGKDSAVDSTCGILTAEPNITNRKTVQTLLTGDVVVAGDFPVKLTQVSGQSSFTGAGYVTVPFLGQNRVKVKFSSISVNTDKQLIGGYFETTYDSTEKQIANLDQVLDGGKDAGIVIRGVDTANYYIDMVIPGVENIKVELNEPSEHNGYSTGGGATLIITGPDGSVKEIKVDQLPTTIKDKDGTIYGIDKDGKVTKVGENGSLGKMTKADLNTLQPNKAVVRFIPHKDQHYAFDAYQPVYANSVLYKEKYEKLAGDYYVNAKLVTEASVDVVKAEITIKDTAIKADSVRFITAKGIRFESKLLSANTWEIHIVGGPGGDAQELYALYPNSDTTYLSLGKLLIASYKPQNLKLVLVPVNDANIDKAAISQQLNAIYNPVAVSFEVTQDAAFNDKSWDLNHDDKLAVSGSGWLSMLTDEMQALNSTYAKARTVQNDAIYLFVMNSSDSSIAGDMPRGKQFGYLFNGADGKVAAHELGHGLFKLKHVFDSDYGFKQGQLSSNVMDYPAGDNFTKYQWDALHDPGTVISIFEKDADAALRMDNVTDFEKLKNVKTGTYTFLSPGGMPVTLPATATAINISETNYFNGIGEKDSLGRISFGTLIGFSLPANDKMIRYIAVGTNGQGANASGTFMGYFYTDDSGRKVYIDSLSAKETERNVIIAFPAMKADTTFSVKARWAQMKEETWKKTRDSGYRASGYMVNAEVYLLDIATDGLFDRYHSPKVPVYDIPGAYSEFEGSVEAAAFLKDNTLTDVMPLPIFMNIANLIKLYPDEYARFVCSRDGDVLKMSGYMTNPFDFSYSDLEKKANPYLNAFTRFIETVKKQNGRLAVATDVKEIKDILATMCAEDYYRLSATERIQIIKVYTNESNWITGCLVDEELKCEEGQLIQVVRTVPDPEQAAALFNYLNSEDNLTVLYRLVHDVDGHNHNAMMEALFELCKMNDERSGFDRGDLPGNRLFYNASFDYDEFSITVNTDQIDFSVQHVPRFTIHERKKQVFKPEINSDKQKKLTTYMYDNGYGIINYIKPLDAVTVVFGEDFVLTDQTVLFHSGDVIRMPALYLWHMLDVDARQTAQLLRNNAKSLAEKSVSYFNLAEEIKVLEYTMTAVDLLFDAYDSKLRPAIDMEKLDAGQKDMVSDFDNVSKAYKLYKDKKEAYEKWKGRYETLKKYWPAIRSLSTKQLPADWDKEAMNTLYEKILKFEEEPVKVVAEDWNAGWKDWEDYDKKEINGEEMASVGQRYYSRQAVNAGAANKYGVLPADVDKAIHDSRDSAYISGDRKGWVHDNDRIMIVTDVTTEKYVKGLSIVDWNTIGLPKAVEHVKFKESRDPNDKVVYLVGDYPSGWPGARLLQACKEAFHDVFIRYNGRLNTPNVTYTGYTKEGYRIEFYFRNDKIESCNFYYNTGKK
ncbi:hypothetical protein A4H97_28155 [Niastella yeongjuensis]|uniref:Fibronectin type-III domain-containing protein n=1 Tax=Niastella yeongjuensis TaxID=354355 RepID=A0A1V9EUD3_9BACT|nr:hypothetical protein [Niastella yeongjuensis]OQP49766.1 hypothetical protein A4H97_28155 [Niastella yeongjuensis]SEP40495.1 TANFOR domain-containing protein [Niastella yeongjuensis]